MKHTVYSHIYTILFEIVVPLVTIVLTAIVFYNATVSNYVALHLLPIFLIIWFIVLMISVVKLIFKLKNGNLSEKQKVIRITYLSISLGGIIYCSFIGLFTRSLLLGGFHAS